jgi:hypothetical protein
MVLDALVQAAEGAAVAGAPQRLRTLRVLGFKLSLAAIGKLVAALPRLHTLQLSVQTQPHPSAGAPDAPSTSQWMKEHLEGLPNSQLQNLYLEGPGVLVCGEGSERWVEYAGGIMAGLLPTGLQRLSWDPLFRGAPVPDLSYLAQLSFLQFKGWRTGGLSSSSSSSSSKVPPHLQELHLVGGNASLEVVQAQQQVLVGLDRHPSNDFSRLYVPSLRHLPKLQATAVRAPELQQPDVCAALKQLSQLGTLTVRPHPSPQPANMQAVVSTAAGIPSLRHLHLKEFIRQIPEMPGLHTLTGLTRVTLSALERVPLNWGRSRV